MDVLNLGKINIKIYEVGLAKLPVNSVTWR